MALIFAARLRELRQSRRLSQEALGRELGISQRFVSNLETGTAEPTPGLLCRIADYFGVSVDWLLGRKGAESVLGLSPEEIATLTQKVLPDILWEAQKSADKQSREPHAYVAAYVSRTLAELFARLLIENNRRLTEQLRALGVVSERPQLPPELPPERHG